MLPNIDPRGAEIRLRYRVATDQRDAARAAAERTRQELLAHGASDVKVEEEVIPTGQARAPEVAYAITLADKLTAMWTARALELEPARAQRLISLANELDAALGHAGGAGAGVGMHFDGIRMRNMGPYRGEVNVDLSKIDGKLVAVCGENGAGKSTFLGLFAGAMHREFYTKRIAKKSLVEVATGRDAFLEAKVVNGRSYTLRHMIDGIAKKSEAVVLGDDGEPIYASTKVGAFDKWADSHVLSPDVLYAGPFAVQGSNGLLEMGAAERYAVFLRALGIEKYERLAEAARKRMGTAKDAAAALRTRIEDERGRMPDSEAARAELKAAEVAIETAVQEREAAITALERMRASAEDARLAAELADRRKAAEGRLERAQQRVTQALATEQEEATLATSKVAKLLERITNNRALLADADAIRADVAEDKRLGEEIATLNAQHLTKLAEHEAAKTATRTAQQAAGIASQAGRRARERVQRAQARLKDKAAVEAAVGRAEELRKNVERLEADMKQRVAERTQLQARQLGHKDERITGLRGALTQIAADNVIHPPADTLAGRAINIDDALIARAAQMPAEIAELGAKLDQHQIDLAAARRELREAEQLAARIAEIRAAETELEAARADQAAAEADTKRLDDDYAAAVRNASALEAAAGEIERARTTLTAARAGLEKVKLGPILEQAEARIQELERTKVETEAAADRTAEQLAARVAEAKAAVTECENELAALPPPPSETPDVDLEAAEQAIAECQEREQAARDAAATARAMIEAAQVCEKRLAVLRAELAGIEQDVADWTRLSLDLGRDGLQSLEVDAAVPELNTRINDLLHACHGPRFTVELRTDRLKKDGSVAEGKLDIWVIDTIEGRGREDYGEGFSGGESAIVGEALALEMTVLACRCAGIEKPTLFRDETSAALSPENKRAYIAMLRRAADMINADKVLFVAQEPELWELADARINIGMDGTVAVN